MKQIIEKIINRINEDSVKISGVFAGSGSSFANWFLTTPGSSNTLMQLDFPYSHGSVDELLGRVPGVYVTEQVANEFATIAYLRASKLVSGGEEVIGIGCTSALISDVPKKGEHRAYVSIRNKDEMLSVSLKLNKGFRDRISEEDLVSRFILNEVDEFWFKSENDTLLSDLSAEDKVCRKENKYYDAVKEGESIVNPLEASGVFPAMVISMVDVGEETGQLPEMLLKVADVYDDEVDNAVAALTSMLEPLMIVMLAVVVGVIVMALFLPMVEIIKGVASQ